MSKCYHFRNQQEERRVALLAPCVAGTDHWNIHPDGLTLKITVVSKIRSPAYLHLSETKFSRSDHQLNLR